MTLNMFTTCFIILYTLTHDASQWYKEYY